MSSAELEPDDPERERGIRLATDALQAAISQDWDAVKAAMSAMNGSMALVYAVVAWADWVLAARNGGQVAPVTDVIGISWLNTDTGDIETADEVPPEVRWAGQVIAARSAMDEDGFMALLHAPAPGTDLNRCVGQLLLMTAEELQGMNAGQ